MDTVSAGKEETTHINLVCFQAIPRFILKTLGHSLLSTSKITDSESMRENMRYLLRSVASSDATFSLDAFCKVVVPPPKKKKKKWTSSQRYAKLTLPKMFRHPHQGAFLILIGVGFPFPLFVLVVT